MTHKTKLEEFLQKHIGLILLGITGLGVWNYWDMQSSETNRKKSTTRQFLKTVQDDELRYFVDEWGTKFRAIEGRDSFGDVSFLLCCAGPDKAFDTSDDIEYLRWNHDLPSRQSSRPMQPTRQQQWQLRLEANQGGFTRTRQSRHCEELFLYHSGRRFVSQTQVI